MIEQHGEMLETSEKGGRAIVHYESFKYKTHVHVPSLKSLVLPFALCEALIFSW